MNDNLIGNLKKHTSIDYKKRVCKAMNFISQNINRDLSIDEIAKSASFSTFHFHRIFRAAVGETVAGFTRRLRLELAANKLLKQTNDITQIAIECGFSSSQNFSKAFKKHFGITPSEYQKSKNGNILSRNEKSLSLRTLYNSDNEFLKLLNGKKRNTIFPRLSELPDYNVAYVRKIGVYDEKTCSEAISKVLHWAYSRNVIAPGKLMLIYWDNPEVTPSYKCRFDACVIIQQDVTPEGDVFQQKIGGGLYAVFSFELSPEKIQQAWVDSFSWICDAGYETRDTPCFELYHNNAYEHSDGKWIFDICIPLKK